MNLNIYKYNSPNNYLNKDLTSIASLTGTLREECSVIDPVIVIEYSGNLSEANYAYIPDLHRYYYITDIDSVSKNLWRIYCHVDVLMTYKPQILNHECVLAKQQYLWNMYLNDGSTFKASNKSAIVQKTFPSGFSGAEFVMLISG